MMRTTFSEKNGRIRLERELKAGESWTLVTRLSAANVTEAVKQYPLLWRGEHVVIGTLGYRPEWDELSDDMECER